MYSQMCTPSDDICEGSGQNQESDETSDHTNTPTHSTKHNTTLYNTLHKSQAHTHTHSKFVLCLTVCWNTISHGSMSSRTYTTHIASPPVSRFALTRCALCYVTFVRLAVLPRQPPSPRAPVMRGEWGLFFAVDLNGFLACFVSFE